MKLIVATLTPATYRILTINSIATRCTCGTWLGNEPLTGRLVHADACTICHHPVSGETDLGCDRPHTCADTDPVRCAHARCAGYADPYSPCQYDHEHCCGCCQPEYDHNADWPGLDDWADDYLN